MANRSANKAGVQTLELVGRLQASIQRWESSGPITDGGDNAPMIKDLKQKMGKGQDFASYWAQYLHDDPPHPDLVTYFKANWRDWQEDSKGVLVFLEQPDDEFLKAVRDGIASGRSTQ